MPTEPFQNPADDSADPVFDQEQSHLAETYAKLQQIGRALVRKMERAQREAAADKKAMAEELAPNFATYADAMETYADFAAMNRVIDGYNLAQDADAAELAKVELLLKQPYFAKVALQFKPGQEPKELYIGTAGISDENYRRLVVDWRSPRGRDLLQPGQRPHLLRGRRPHHHGRSQAAPPVRHRAKTA